MNNTSTATATATAATTTKPNEFSFKNVNQKIGFKRGASDMLSKSTTLPATNGVKADKKIKKN